MNHSTDFIIVVFFSALASISARAETDAEEPCSINLHKVARLIEKYEAPNSTGKIEACIPSKDPKNTTATLAKDIDASADRVQADHKAYLAVLPKLNEFNQMAAEQGHICGATDDVKEKGAEIKRDLHKAVGDLFKDYFAYQLSRDQFAKIYGKRKPALAKLFPVPQRAPFCRDTETSLGVINYVFVDANESCDKLVLSAAKQKKSVDTLELTLAAGCNRRKCREVVADYRDTADATFHVEFQGEDGTWYPYSNGDLFVNSQIASALTNCQLRR